MNTEQIQLVVQEVIKQLSLSSNDLPTEDSKLIPVAVSARHVHLKQEHVELLFGEGYELTEKSPLSQPGQFAANEQVVIVGPKGSISKVRVLGPARDLTQVEVSATDARTLGIKAPLRQSGDIQHSGAITIVGPKGSLYLNEGVIVAAAHIHMSPAEASRFQVVDGQFVSIRINSERPLVLQKVKIRVSDRYRLEMHIDTDEANAAFVEGKAFGEIISIDELSSSVPIIKNATEHVSTKASIKYEKKLLSDADIRMIEADEIIVAKQTIVTALARDTARSKGIIITMRDEKRDR